MRYTSKLIPLFLLFVVPVSFAQDITARFYPEKQGYVVGEPIVIVLEVKNGTSQAIQAGEDDCDWMHPNEFHVTNAPIISSVSLFGCAPLGGIAGDCLIGAQKSAGERNTAEEILAERIGVYPIRR